MDDPLVILGAAVCVVLVWSIGFTVGVRLAHDVLSDDD